MKKNIFSEVEKGKGFSLEEVEKAENRLGIKLPEELRNFYLTQGRNIALKGQTGVIEPEHLRIEKNLWLLFWAEDVGVCYWAIKMNDLTKKEQPIYIRHDGYEFIREANNLVDFLIVRAAGDFSNCIYAYRMYGDIINEDEKILESLFGMPKSDANTKPYFHVKLYWISSNFVVRTVKYSNNRGFKMVVYSKSKNNFSGFHNAFSHKDWTIIEDKTLRTRKNIEEIENPKNEKEDFKLNDDNLENYDFDLPF